MRWPSPPRPRSTAHPAGRRDDTRLALLFILPALLGFLVFMVWPTLRGIYLSFTKFNLLTPPEFNGLDNYIRMVQDPVFWNALKVTLYYVVVNIGLQTVLALVIAVMMQRLTKRTWLRGIVLTPYLVSNVVAAMVFLWILDYQLGIGNTLIAAIGLDRIPFLSSDAVGHPDHRADQRLAARRLHRPADLRRPADHPGDDLRGGPDRRRERARGCSAASPSRCCARCWRWS